MRHQHDAVAGGDAEERDESNQRSDREYAAGQEYPGHAADQRQRQVDHDDGGVAGGPECAEQDQEDAGDGAEPESQEEALGCDLGFELSAVLDAVAVRERDAGRHLLPHVGDDSPEIPPGDIRADDYPPLAVLARDEVGTAVFDDVGEAAQRHARPGGHVEARLPHILQVGHVVGPVAQHQRHGHLAVDDLSHLSSEQHRFQGRRGLAGGQPVAGERVPVEADVHRRDVGLRLQRQVDEAGDVLQRGHGLAAERPQHGQVVSKNLDGNIGAGTRQHMVDAVGDRLSDGDIGAGHERQAVPDLFEDDGPRPAAGQQPHVDLRRFNALDVLVELRPPGPARRRGDFRYIEQQPFDGAAQRIRLRQAGAGQRHGADDERAFVERRQEGASHPRDACQRRGEQEGGRADHQPRTLDHARQQARVYALEHGGQRRLTTRADSARARQQVQAERRRHGQGDDQRRKQRNQIGEPERLQQAALDPRQEEERQEDQHDDDGRENDGRADFAAGAIHHFQGGAPLRCRQRGVLAQPPRDVFDIDHGVVHQRPDGDGHAAEGHAVDRQPGQPQTDNGGQQRQGYREQCDGAGAEIREEQQGDDDYEQRAVAQRGDQVAERQLDEVRLPEQQRVEPHAGRQLGLRPLQHAFELARQGERVDVRLPVNAEDDGRLAVVGAVPALDRLSDAKIGHVAYADGQGAARGNDRRADVFDVARPAGALNQKFLSPRLPEPGRGVAAGAS